MHSRTASQTAPHTVDELMDLLYSAQGAEGTPGAAPDPYEHALRTAAQLRRTHPSDKELQVAGLVQYVGLLLPGGSAGDATAAALRPLLGERVARLAGGLDPLADDLVTLRQAAEAARSAGFDPGILEDWRPVLELLAAARM